MCESRNFLWVELVLSAEEGRKGDSESEFEQLERANKELNAQLEAQLEAQRKAQDLTDAISCRNEKLELENKELKAQAQSAREKSIGDESLIGPQSPPPRWGRTRKRPRSGSVHAVSVAKRVVVCPNASNTGKASHQLCARTTIINSDWRCTRE